MPSSLIRPKRSSASSTISQRGSGNIEKTGISINVYDLLPPGRLSSLLWTLGGSLLHSGVVIGGREYAYGGHNHRNTTGVYYTNPHFEPPGATFRSNIIQGFAFRTQAEIDHIVREVSEEFLGERYNLLTNNCNHFTNALCKRLTGKEAPKWLNRAASIGLALPCMVPGEWINPPDHETAEGDLLDEGEEDEQAAMLESDRRQRRREDQKRQAEYDDGGKRSILADGRRIYEPVGTPPPRLVSVKDTSGREMPVAERAPLSVKR